MIFVVSCQSTQAPSVARFTPPSKLTDRLIQASVESPVGSFNRLQYDLVDGHLDTLSQNTMPLPINAGFLLADHQGTPKKLNVWIIGKRMTLGDTLAIEPIALINYDVAGTTQQEVVAIPKSKVHRTIHVNKLQDLLILHDPVKFNFEYWLRQENRSEGITRLVWEDEVKALEFLKGFFSN